MLKEKNSSRLHIPNDVITTALLFFCFVILMLLIIITFELITHSVANLKRSEIALIVNQIRLWSITLQICRNFLYHKLIPSVWIFYQIGAVESMKNNTKK